MLRTATLCKLVFLSLICVLLSACAHHYDAALDEARMDYI